MKTIKLSVKDSQEFLKTLANPPKANKALKEAFRKYKKEVKII